MPACGNCGRHVTATYHLVFADEHGVVHGCPDCTAHGRAGRRG